MLSPSLTHRSLRLFSALAPGAQAGLPARAPCVRFANRKRGSARLRGLAILLIPLAANTAPAAMITDIFNTGVSGTVNTNTTLIAAGVTDPHYDLISQPTGSTFPDAVAVDDTQFPFPPWVPNNAGSRWIAPEINGGPVAPVGTYVYQTDFNVPATAILSTVSISGLWSSDNAGAMLLNGTQVSTSIFPSFLTQFHVTGASLFQHGTNTLTFSVFNDPGSPISNPTGLRVDAIAGTYQVPEPASLAVAGLGAVALLLRCRRRGAATADSEIH